MLGTLASAGSSEGADPEKTNKEREEKEGNSLIWKCNFDSETVFLFQWPRGSEGKVGVHPRLSSQSVCC